MQAIPVRSFYFTLKMILEVLGSTKIIKSNLTLICIAHIAHVSSGARALCFRPNGLVKKYHKDQIPFIPPFSSS